MKKNSIYTLMLLIGLSSFLQAAPLGTTFTYQGRLSSGTNPANGLYDFNFVLYDAETAGTPQGITLATKPSWNDCSRKKKAYNETVWKV